jgi:hypothetical protein
MTTTIPTTTRTSGVVAIVASVALALIGLAAGAAGGLLFGLFGSDGTVASGSHPISTSRTALVSSVADISDVSDLEDIVGEPRVRFTARGAEPFIGIGPAEQVDRYLASVPIDEVTDFEIDPFELQRRAREGSRRPEPPANQGFWVAQGTGPERATVNWKVRDGDYRLVVMNADAGRSVTVSGDVGLTLPHVSRIAWGLVIGGGLLLVAGIAGIGFAVRRRAA